MQMLLFFVAFFAYCANLSYSAPIIGQPIFKGLNQTQQTQLHSILFNPNSTRASIKSGVSQWVSDQHNQTLQKIYDDYQKLKGEWKKLFIEVHNERVRKLSNEAKDLDTKLMAVYLDDSLTIGETCKRIDQLIMTAPDFVAKELFRAIRKCSAGDADNFINPV